MTGLIIDASVTANWRFEDEETQFARDVLRQAQKINERRKRITPPDTARGVTLFKELAVQVDPAGSLQPFDAPLLSARAHGLTAYDASYLDLALREGLPLATLDVRLRTAATAAGVNCMSDST